MYYNYWHVLPFPLYWISNINARPLITALSFSKRWPPSCSQHAPYSRKDPLGEAAVSPDKWAHQLFLRKPIVKIYSLWIMVGLVFLFLACPEACGIFLDQGWKLCFLPWQADSLPQSHQGSPRHFFFLIAKRNRIITSIKYFSYSATLSSKLYRGYSNVY